MSLLLLWLRTNWTTVLLATLPWALIGGVYWYADSHGYGRGYAKAESEYKEKLADMTSKAVALEGLLQTDKDRRVAEQEAARAKSEKVLADATRRLRDEIAKNSAYDTCDVGRSFLQIHRSVAAHSASGVAASKSDIAVPVPRTP